MSGFNNVQLLGNLGADPELRVTPEGARVMRMRLATSRTWLDAQRVRQERTEWHSIVVWGKRAEALAKFLVKGHKLFVQGELRHRQWEHEGQKRYATEVVAREVVLCDRPPRGAGASPPDDAYDRYEGDDAPPDDDIPF